MILRRVRQFLFFFYFSVIGGGGGQAKKKNFRGGGGGRVILSRVGQFFFVFLSVKGREEVEQRTKI